MKNIYQSLLFIISRGVGGQTVIHDKKKIQAAQVEIYCREGTPTLSKINITQGGIEFLRGLVIFLIQTIIIHLSDVLLK